MTVSVTNLASLIGLQNENGEIVGIDFAPIIASINKAMGAKIDEKAVSDAISEALKQALSIDIGAILGQSWKSVGAVATAMKETAKTAQSRAFVPLAKHQIQTSLEPQISLLRDGLLNVKLPVDANLSWEIMGAEVEVSAGQLSSFKLGSLMATGTLKFAGQTIFKINPSLFEPKGRINFKTPTKNEMD